MEIRARLSLNMRRLRQSKGWSQEEFAHQAGLHRTYVSDLERGARNPTIEARHAMVLTALLETAADQADRRSAKVPA